MPSNTRIVGLFPDFLAHGGVQEAGRQTAAALSAIADNRGGATQFLTLNDPHGVQSVEVGDRSISFTGFHRAKVQFVLAALKATRNDARLLFAGHPNLAPPAALARRFSRRLKTIVVTHGIEVWTPLPPQRRNALLKADVILAPSSYTKQKLIEVQGVPEAKIRRLPWPLDPEFLKLAQSPSELALPSRFPKNGGPVILSVGRWAASEKYKGADDLIRAAGRLRANHAALSLVLVGAGDDLPRLKSIATAENLNDSVTFLENLSRAELCAYYAHADVFALPSTGEGFGLVFLEAMAFAKPVVGVASGGTLDLIRDGKNGLLVPPSKENPEALIYALDRLLRDQGLRGEMGRNGAAVVANEYSVSTFQQSLELIIAGLLA
jgi:glycosyltransferase involved in cell wall biosynthesis